MEQIELDIKKLTKKVSNLNLNKGSMEEHKMLTKKLNKNVL